LLLLILQGLSPLVHAHVHEDGGEYGLHIDGLTGQVSQRSELQLSSSEVVGHVHIAINMQPAIQQQNILKANLPTFAFYKHQKNFTSPLRIEKQLIFFSVALPNTPSYYLATHSSRAPPVLVDL